MGLKSIVSSLVLAGFFVGGCGEYITFSKDSRERGLQYMASSQTEEAKGAFRDATRQNPRDYKSYHYLGELYAKSKEYLNAISNYKTSLNVQNVTIDGKQDIDFKMKTIERLADVLAVSDTRDSKIDELSKVAALSTTGDEYLVLAKAFAKRGDADSAMDAYAHAVSQAPLSFYVAKDQGLYLEQVGHKPLAEQALRRAYRLNDKDEQVNAALRRIGVVPGPALKEENELVKPLIPRGPIPDYINRDRPGSPTAPRTGGATPAD